MIIESAQILSTAHFILDGHQVGYKPTHKNHPCCVWVRASSSNYDWMMAHFVALCGEYTHRGGKIHKTEGLVPVLSSRPRMIVDTDMTVMAMCMPDECKASPSVYENYRIYLNKKFSDWASRTEKRPIIAKWTARTKPLWIN